MMISKTGNQPEIFIFDGQTEDVNEKDFGICGSAGGVNSVSEL